MAWVTDQRTAPPPPLTALCRNAPLQAQSNTGTAKSANDNSATSLVYAKRSPFTLQCFYKGKPYNVLIHFRKGGCKCGVSLTRVSQSRCMNTQFSQLLTAVYLIEYTTLTAFLFCLKGSLSQMRTTHAYTRM